jgi:hypothetical protein
MGAIDQAELVARLEVRLAEAETELQDAEAAVTAATKKRDGIRHNLRTERITYWTIAHQEEA